MFSLNRLGFIIPTEMEAEALVQGTEKLPLIISGIGKVNAVMAYYSLLIKGARKVIMLGTCASLKNHPQGTVIYSTRFAEHDMDCRGLGFELGETPYGGGGKIYDTSHNVEMAEVYDRLFKYCQAEKLPLATGTIISGDKFMINRDEALGLQKQFKADCIDMESAAVAKAALKDGVPYATIKIITDNADTPSAVAWQVYVKEASKMLNGIMKGVFYA
jgi:adenosylhomocysteine nucleosidase